MRGTRRRFLRSATALTAVGLAGCVERLTAVAGDSAIEADGGPATQAEVQFRGGLDRRGVYPEATIPDDIEVDWRLPGVNTGEHTAAKASPVLAPTGDVIVPGDTGKVLSVAPHGELSWLAETNHSSRGIHGTPTVANGAVYIGAYDGALYAFDLETGERYWRSKLGDAIGSSPGYHDGRVLIAVEYYTPSGAMFSVDALTGRVRWRDPRPSNHPHSTCAVDTTAGRLVVGDNDGYLYAWSYPDLEFEWAFPTDGPIKGPVATHDGAAYVCSWDHYVYRVALDDGTEEWAFETGADAMTGPSVEPATGTVYVGSHDNRLYALDMETGEERWRFETDGSLIGCPTVTRDHVLVGTYAGTLYAVTKEGGEAVWHLDTPGRMTSTPLVTDEAIYVTNRASEAFLEDGDGPTGSLYRLVAAD